MQGARSLPRLSFGARIEAGERILPEEVGVALTFNGTTQAVMMATPEHLADFAYGFALTEGLAHPDDIESLEVAQTARGLDVQIWVSASAEARLKDRRRTMIGPVGCGLCGIESLEQALRTVAPVDSAGFTMTPSQIKGAIEALPDHQSLHDVTRAVHGAAWWADGSLLCTREDVGRHNALDKLAGALVRSQAGHRRGAVVLTSRVSIDLVQKVAAMGAPMIIAVSSPTADAVTLADALGLTLIAQARPDRFEVFTHTDRIATETEHVR